MCKIGFRNVRLYGLGIMLSPSISETVSIGGVIEFKNTFFNWISHTARVGNNHALKIWHQKRKSAPGKLHAPCSRSLWLVTGLFFFKNYFGFPLASRNTVLLMHFRPRRVCTQLLMTGICLGFAHTFICVS